jgi:hypothetical protein
MVELLGGIKNLFREYLSNCCHSTSMGSSINGATEGNSNVLSNTPILWWLCL